MYGYIVDVFSSSTLDDEELVRELVILVKCYYKIYIQSFNNYTNMRLRSQS